MCSILISINPKHVENIFNGTKKYEFPKDLSAYGIKTAPQSYIYI